MEKRMTNPKSEGYISAKDMAGRAAYYKVLQAAKNGELTRIKRGVYATDDHLASQMLDVEKVVPGGVLCLYSAWSHYQLTTQVPQEYCLAIKRGRKITLPDYPPITLYHWSDTAFNLGITNTEIEGFKVRIYDVEKCVCDADQKADRKLELPALVNQVCEMLRMPMLKTNPLFAGTVDCCRKK